MNQGWVIALWTEVGRLFEMRVKSPLDSFNTMSSSWGLLLYAGLGSIGRWFWGEEEMRVKSPFDSFYTMSSSWGLLLWCPIQKLICGCDVEKYIVLIEKMVGISSDLKETVVPIWFSNVYSPEIRFV